MITVVAVLVLVLYTRTVDHVADVAATARDLATLRSPSFVLHSSVGAVLLLVATALGVYKTRGLTRYGRRRQQAARAAAEPAARS